MSKYVEVYQSCLSLKVGGPAAIVKHPSPKNFLQCFQGWANRRGLRGVFRLVRVGEFVYIMRRKETSKEGENSNVPDTN